MKDYCMCVLERKVNEKQRVHNVHSVQCTLRCTTFERLDNSVNKNSR